MFFGTQLRSGGLPRKDSGQRSMGVPGLLVLSLVRMIAWRRFWSGRVRPLTLRRLLASHRRILSFPFIANRLAFALLPTNVTRFLGSRTFTMLPDIRRGIVAGIGRNIEEILSNFTLTSREEGLLCQLHCFRFARSFSLCKNRIARAESVKFGRFIRKRDQAH